jgi:SAM-dependent methyltransferase
MSSLPPDHIHAAVREHYGALARSSSSCCGPSDGDASCCSPLYPSDQLIELPATVTDISLGCGDPVSLADIRPGDTVLDLGSGGGIDCFLAAKRVGPAGRVIGVDMTPDMLARARANAAKLGATNVEFRQGQIEALPVDDAAVDVVISNCVINLSPDKPQVFREIFRVLRPGGRVAVSDIVTAGPMSALVAQGLAAWSECVAGALPVADYEAGLRAAGFVDVRATPKDDAAEPGTKRLAPTAGLPFSASITARKP